MKTFSTERVLLITSILCFFMSLFLFSWHAWFRFVVIEDWEEKVQVEEQALADFQLEQDAMMSVETRDFLDRYSDLVLVLESVLSARDMVFSGEMSADRFEPLVVLDLLEFFRLFRAHLSAEVLVQKLSLSSEGELSFLVQTTSYHEAARQSEVFRKGFKSESDLPHFFQDIEISSVTKSDFSLQEQEKLPDLFQGKTSHFDFVVQMQINPRYFSALRAREELEDEAIL